MRCHAQIEDVHTKVIRGELWEKAPGAIPACTDCHVPHRVRKEVTELTISDRNCLKCHEQAHLYSYENGDTLLVTVSASDLAASAHKTIPCVKCHVDVDPRLKRPCEPSGAVDCSNCHAKISEEYTVSGHGQAHAKGIEQAPYCTDCHGSTRHSPTSTRRRTTGPPFRAATAIAPKAKPRWRARISRRRARCPTIRRACTGGR
jgi:hypothetical protein